MKEHLHNYDIIPNKSYFTHASLPMETTIILSNDTKYKAVLLNT